MKRGIVATVLILAALGSPALAQEDAPTASTAVDVSTEFVGVTVKPGDSANFDLTVLGPSDDRVVLSVDGLPEGWKAEFRGGGFIVNEVLIPESGSVTPDLRIEVPADAADGAYQATVQASGTRSSDRLELTITVAADAGGGVSLATEFPALRGPADVTFSFTLELTNDTSEEIQFGLQTQGPAGWQIEARPSGQSRASTVTVAAGENERITVEVDPPDFAEAGLYPILVQAAGSGQTATAELAVEITGNFDLSLFTADERLNVDVEAGNPTDLTLIVANSGTALLNEVGLRATPPTGWEVTFSPETIAQLEPGTTAEVTATITPAEDAIAGDYSLGFVASTPEVSDQIEVRATVKTSTIWGLVGVGIIVAALVILSVVFRRFGRR